MCCKGYFFVKRNSYMNQHFCCLFWSQSKTSTCRKRKFCEIFRKFVGSKFVKHVISSLLMLVVLGFFDQKFPNWILNFWSVWHPKDWACPRIQVVMSRRGCENLHNQLGNVKNYMLLLNYVSYLMVR